MKFKITLFRLISISLLFCCLYFISCSDSSTSPTNNNSYTPPSIQLKKNATYVYQNDTIPPSGIQQTQPVLTYDRIMDSVTFQSRLGYQIFDSNRTSPPPGTFLNMDTIYLSYDSAKGRLYQYGIERFINPSQSLSWDLIADFSIPLNQSWTIGNVNYSIVVSGTLYTFNGPLTAKVAVDTTLLGRGNAGTVKCYRIELNAAITGNAGLIPVNFNVIIDDFIGYNSSSGNYSGIMRVRVRPFTVYNSGAPLLQLGGHDRFIQDLSIPTY